MPLSSDIGLSSKGRPFRTAVILSVVLLVVGCGEVRRSAPPDPRETAEYGLQLQKVHRQMLDDSEERTEVDRKIAEAVEQLGQTLWPAYKETGNGGRWRMGFLEISDVERRTVTRFHKYLTEKILTFSFLEPEITRRLALVERFTVSDVWRAATAPPHRIDREFRFRRSDRSGRFDRTDRFRRRVSSERDYLPYRIIDSGLARRLGRRYDVDLIETGVATVSGDFIDVNLRMVETEYGRIVAVGSAKIPRTPTINRWLHDLKPSGPADTGLIPDQPKYRFPDRRP